MPSADTAMWEVATETTRTRAVGEPLNDGRCAELVPGREHSGTCRVICRAARYEFAHAAALAEEFQRRTGLDLEPVGLGAYPRVHLSRHGVDFGCSRERRSLHG
jgi:hypothetical protein